MMVRMYSAANVWKELEEGNQRFMKNEMLHPSQYAGRRAELEEGQRPLAAILGCSDSRVPGEVIFDRGLGDLFMVRTAGHIIDPGVLGSLEYAVQQCNVPVLVVLGHEQCGAVGAAANAMETGQLLDGYLRDVIQRIVPSLIAAGVMSGTDIKEALVHHVTQTVNLLLERSTCIRHAVEDGNLSIVGAIYRLGEGRVEPIQVTGDLDIPLG